MVLAALSSTIGQGRVREWRAQEIGAALAASVAPALPRSRPASTEGEDAALAVVVPGLIPLVGLVRVGAGLLIVVLCTNSVGRGGHGRLLTLAGSHGEATMDLPAGVGVGKPPNPQLPGVVCSLSRIRVPVKYYSRTRLATTSSISIS